MKFANALVKTFDARSKVSVIHEVPEVGTYTYIYIPDSRLNTPDSVSLGCSLVFSFFICHVTHVLYAFDL